MVEEYRQLYEERKESRRELFAGPEEDEKSSAQEDEKSSAQEDEKSSAQEGNPSDEKGVCSQCGEALICVHCEKTCDLCGTSKTNYTKVCYII